MEDVDKKSVPREVRDERKVTGANLIYFNGFFDVRPVRGRAAVEYGSRSDAAAAGEFAAGLIKELFR